MKTKDVLLLWLMVIALFIFSVVINMIFATIVTFMLSKAGVIEFGWWFVGALTLTFLIINPSTYDQRKELLNKQ